MRIRDFIDKNKTQQDMNANTNIQLVGYIEDVKIEVSSDCDSKKSKVLILLSDHYESKYKLKVYVNVNIEKDEDIESIFKNATTKKACEIFNIDKRISQNEIVVSNMVFHDFSYLYSPRPKEVNIREVKKLSADTIVKFSGLLSNVKPGVKKDSTPFRIVTFQDETDTVSFPLWDCSLYSDLQENTVYEIVGKISYYDGVVQVKNPTISILKKENIKKEYIPNYLLYMEEIEDFFDIIEYLDDNYRIFAKKAFGLDMFNKVLPESESEPDIGFSNSNIDLHNRSRWTKFLRAPASEKMHHNKLGGLFKHTYGVLKNLLNFIDNYENSEKAINKSRLLLKGMLHDYKKVDEYEYETVIKRKEDSLGHIILGVSYVLEINKELDYIFPEEEINNICYSILSHHGEFGKHKPKTIEDTLLHLADMVDSKIVGETDKISE